MRKINFLIVLLVALLLLVACGSRSNGTSTGSSSSDPSSSTSSSSTSEPTQSTSSSASTDADEKDTGENAPEPLAQRVPIKIAEDGSASGAGFYIADKRGYFDEMGLDIEFVTFSDSAAMLPAIASNQVQVAGGIVSVSLLNAFDRGIDIKILADKGHNVAGKSYFDIVLRKDLAPQLQGPADLKGKKIAIASKGSANEFYLAVLLEAGGLTLDDVEVVEIGDFAQMTVALSTGAIDGAMHIEPFITQGVNQGILDRWIDLADVYPNSQNAIMLASPAFVEDIEVSGRFMYAYLKALREYNDAFFKDINKEEIIEIMTEYTELKDAELWRQVNVAGLEPNGRIFVEDLERETAYFKEHGYFEGTVNFSDLIYLKPAEYALEYLGEYK